MIACPHCAFNIELKGVRAGAFQPKCPRCHEKFALTVSADPAVPPKVAKLAESPASATIAPRPSPAITHAPAATLPPAAAPRTHTAPTVAPPVAPVPKPSAAHASIAATAPPTHAPVHAASMPAAQVPVAPAPLPPTPTPVEVADLAPGVALGGYTVLQKLGSGGMGAVYLARQNSLDRHVALKTLRPDLADDPQLVARFTREAYAAAQLTHHNIVQIYDIGQERGTNFFSMEFVQGKTLSDVLKETHKLDAETGVGYILQAARGLKFAHEHGLIHRDIKPENLLLNDQGVVKVADLGLVKRVGTGEESLTSSGSHGQSTDLAATQFNKSMGTPLYMPPEQAMDAAHVDQRADIYSLGCTLYHLVTGQPPFTGRTAMEVMTKHASAPVTPPDVVVKDVPHALSPLIVRMLAKRPDGRYPAMKDVIDAFEGFLGIASVGPYTPAADQIKTLEVAAAEYNASPWTRLRPQVVMAFYAACALIFVLLAYINRGDPITATNLAGGVIGLMLMTTIAYHITAGVLQRTHMFLKMRQLAFGAGIKDWLTWIGGIAVFGFVVYAFGLWVPWLFAAIGGVMLAQAFYWTFDVMAAKAREPSLRHAEFLLKHLRGRGVDETELRHFTCRFAGKQWEAFFEALFGYEDKLAARTTWGKERGKDRPKFAAWREPVIAYMDHRIEARKRAREARLLAKLEQKAMQAKGIDEKLAQKQAAKNAKRLVASAAKMKDESARPLAATMAPPTGRSVTAPAMPAMNYAASMLADSPAHGDEHDRHDDRHWDKQSHFARRYGTPLQIVTAPFWRAVIGLVLLAVFAQWWTSTSGRNVAATGSGILATHREDAADIAQKKDVNIAGLQTTASAALTSNVPMTIPLVPDRLTKNLKAPPFFIAGLLLVVGAVFRGKILGFLMYLAAIVAMVGPYLNLPLVAGNVFVCGVVAAAIWVMAIIFCRVKYA